MVLAKVLHNNFKFWYRYLGYWQLRLLVAHITNRPYPPLPVPQKLYDNYHKHAERWRVRGAAQSSSTTYMREAPLKTYPGRRQENLVERETSRKQCNFLLDTDISLVHSIIWIQLLDDKSIGILYVFLQSSPVRSLPKKEEHTFQNYDLKFGKCQISRV
jgi:hypothetical protein